MEKLGTSQIQHQLIGKGLKIGIMEAQPITKTLWKQTITLPKGKDFDKEILKRVGTSLEDKGKGKKKQRQKLVDADRDVDMVMEGEKSTQGSDVDMVMESEKSTQGSDVEMSGPAEPQEKDKSLEPPPCGQPQVTQWPAATEQDLDLPEGYLNLADTEEDF